MTNSLDLPLQKNDFILINRYDHIFSVVRKINGQFEKFTLEAYKYLFMGLAIENVEAVLLFLVANLNLKLGKIKNNFQDLQKENFVYQLV